MIWSCQRRPRYGPAKNGPLASGSIDIHMPSVTPPRDHSPYLLVASLRLRNRYRGMEDHPYERAVRWNRDGDIPVHFLNVALKWRSS